MVSKPTFQIFECQNPDCRLRFPSNLSIEKFEKCPLCGSIVLPDGVPFSNLKVEKAQPSDYDRRIDVLLDNLRSTLNVGSIFRTANCAAINHIYCCGTTPTPEHAKFVKSGLNSEQTVSWSYHRNGLDLVRMLKRDGKSIHSLELTAESKSIISSNTADGKGEDLLLVVGNEISGIDPGILDESDSIVYIPMLGSKTSLNVSIAAAISIYIYRFSLFSSLQ
jgi:tRNA G18 (ribose-2'-O)-methylase SpoU